MIIGVSFFCLLVAYVSGKDYANDVCGLRPVVDKVVGGFQSVAGDWPWSCSMRSSGRHICGGSLIAPDWVVTAAHCVGSPASTYTVQIGVHDRTLPEPYAKTFQVRRVVAHPSYNSRLIQHDIALLQIDPVGTYNDYIMPVCWPQPTQNFAGQTCIATGWGSTQSGGAVTRYQMEVAMPVLTDAACKAKFGGTNNMLNDTTACCAGITGANKDTCQGDSGGPLVVKDTDGFWKLIGLTSWGYGCGDGGVYTKCSFFRSWVEQIMGKPLLGPTGNPTG